MSNINVGQIIMDAQRMTSRVKDLDALLSALLVEAEGNNRLVEGLRQFHDDIDSLNRISNNKSNADMVNRIQQQNANSSEILKENRELKVCIEDYERAMELIMQKYREHTTNKVLGTKINFKEFYNEKLWKIIREQREKITEMAAVMQRAASLDDEHVVKEMETMARLQMENKTLRELLQISKQFGSDGRQIRYNEHLLLEKAVQTEADDSADELSLSGASIENANNNSAIHISITATDNAPPGNDNNNEPPAALLTSTTDCAMDVATDQQQQQTTQQHQQHSSAMTTTNTCVGNNITSPSLSSSTIPSSSLSSITSVVIAAVDTSNITTNPTASAT